MRVDPKTARTISRIAAVVAAAVALILPLGYFGLSYQNQAGELDAEAEINGRIATAVINANPEMWRFQQLKLEEFLSRRPRHGKAEIRRILDTEDKIIAESVDPLRPPLLTRSMELRDSGVTVGRIEISRSLLPLLLQTAGVALFSLLLGAAVFMTLKILPLRALDHALADNTRLYEETLEKAEKLKTLNELARLITSSLSTQEVFDFIVSSGAKLLNAKMVRLWIEDHASGGFTVHASYGVAPELLKQTTTVPVIRPGEGVLGEIIETRTPAYILDAREEPRWLNKQMIKALGLVSVAAVPIIMGDRVLGVLTMMTGERREFTEEEKDLLKGLADQAAVAIENAHLYEQTQRNLERIRALREIDKAITSTLDLHDILNVLLEKIDLFLPYSTATIRLLNKESGLLEPVACRNLDEEEWKAGQGKAGRGPANVVFETKAPMMIRNCYNDPRVRDPAFFRKHALVSYLGVPLIAKEEILGVLSFYTKEEHEFTSEEVEFLTTLAGQAAIAIHNSGVYEEMAELASDLSRSNRVKDEFLSVMSHELRTPLNVVMGYTGMIRDGLLGEINPEQEKALEKVISRARDQLTMITSILQAVQMEAEGVKVESQEVSLRDFLDDLRSHYQIPLGKELTLTWDYPSDLPVVKTDSEKLKHILENLVNNAIRFTERGTITVSARYFNGARAGESSRKQEKGNSQDGVVELKVSDTGVGIAKEHFPVIFERFRQVDSSETRRYGGVGIGLYIVKKFTELLGGKVEVESQAGKGSIFTVTIPVDIHQRAEKGEARVDP